MIHTEQFQREVAMTDEDCGIREWHIGIGRDDDYAYRVADRNDSALMHGLMLMSKTGCRAMKTRFLAGL